MMTMLYVDPLTGDTFDEPQEGCLEIEVPKEEEEQQPDREWLPNYFMERFLTIKAKREVLQAQLEVRMESLAQEERTLNWRYRARLEQVVLREVTGTKRKSVDYDYGRAGIRKSTKTIVSDEDAAMSWAENNCPEAVKVVTTKKLLKSVLPKSETVPGVERVSESTFYVSYPK